MRRMLRRTFNLAAAVSAALFAATVALWTRSYSYSDAVGYVAPDPSHYSAVAVTETGGLTLVAGPTSPGEMGEAGFFRWSTPREYRGCVHFGTGFGAGWKHGTAMVASPLWFATLLTLIAPAVVLMSSLKWKPALRRLKRLNLCPACGYDLRATPARCPECWAVPKRLIA